MLWDIGNGAMNDLRYWQLRDNACEYTTFFLSLRRDEFMAALTIGILIANSCTRWRRIFIGLSQDGGWANFSKNLLASFFNKYLSNEPNFSRIHLAGQYL
jgi:hypothetical protein